MCAKSRGGMLMKYAVIDTNVLALFDDGAVLVTDNKRHFPAADFILTPSEFVETINAQV